MRTKRTRSQAGFSLLEMMLVVAILMIVMGTVFKQINTVQQRYQTEEQRVDITQESREFFDEISRDLHQVGFPNQKMYAPNVLWTASPAEWYKDRRVAAGFLRVAYDQIQFEGDVDGDGSVDVVTYQLFPDPNTGRCPCTLSRSSILKIDGAGTAGAQGTSFNADLNEVINSGGANSGANGVARYQIDGVSHLGGTNQLNDTFYAAYKNANVFTAFDSKGNQIPLPTTNAAVLQTIRIVRVNLNVLANRPDPQTGIRPTVTLSASVRIPSNM